MLCDAFAHCEGEIETAKGKIAFFEPGDDAEGMEVVVKAERMLVKGFVESLFTGVAERWMAYVVSESESLGEFGVKAESVGNGPGDLGDFEGVREAAAKVIAWEFSGETREDLSFPGEAAEGACVKDAGAITSEGRSIGMVGFWILAGRELSFKIDRDFWRKEEASDCGLAHRE
jgi:hypothetical protein